MHRREFSRGLIGAGLAAPMLIRPEDLAARQRDERDRAIEQFARLSLVLGNRTFLITWLIIMMPTLLWGLDFRRAIPRFPLITAGLGGVFSGLTRRSASQRFADATLLGPLYLIGTILILLPFLTNLNRFGRVSVAHREFEYAHPGRLRQIRIRGLPTPAELALLQFIGEVYLNQRGELMFVVDPLAGVLPFREPRAEVAQRVRRTNWSDF